jgi:hypothetical protein
VAVAPPTFEVTVESLGLLVVEHLSQDLSTLLAVLGEPIPQRVDLVIGEVELALQHRQSAAASSCSS